MTVSARRLIVPVTVLLTLGCSQSRSPEKPKPTDATVARTQEVGEVQSVPQAMPAPPPPPRPASVAERESKMVVGLTGARADNDEGFNREAYDRIVENGFVRVADQPLSTFSADVDTASYANVRRFLTGGSLPPVDAVRIEELVNYFTYDDPAPEGNTPFSVRTEVAACPWNLDNRLMRIGIKGRTIPEESRSPANLVFLLDVSGSMNSPHKLPLLKSALKMLVDNLGENDRVSIVVYAGASGLVLPPTPCHDRQTIHDALDRLQAGGSTNGASGIQLAYQQASEHFIEGGVNRVLLATDGDFNVGVTNRGDLTRLIEEKARTGVFLTILGFGMGNLQDATLEELSGRGNGTYAYIDSEDEARKVLVEEMGGSLVTIAKDVKLQVEFNPAEVAAYRLVGYENLMLQAQDFNDDTKDAGEIGAGHSITALYEIVPAGTPVPGPSVDALKYQETSTPSIAAGSGELLTLKLRYKEPDQSKSRLLTVTVTDSSRSYDEASADFRFAAAVATFGMVLRDSDHRGTATFQTALELAEDSAGFDRFGHRQELLELIEKARSLSRG